MRKITPKKSNSTLSEKPMDKPTYPSFRMQLDQLPEAKDIDVGDKCSIKMMAKMVGKSESKFQNDAEFEVHEIEMKGMGAMKDEKMDDMKGGKKDDMNKMDDTKDHKKM